MPDLDMGAPYDVILFPLANQIPSERIFINEIGDTEVGWNEKEFPSHTKAWKETDNKRVPCTFHIGYGFMTQDEIWEQRQKYPRDSL